MDTTTRAASPLRQRMLEDMRMRKLEPRTQEGYIRAVRKLTVYLKRSPDSATVEDLRNFQLRLVDTGTSPFTLNHTLTALKQTSRQDRYHEVQRLMEYALWRMAGIAASLVLFALMR